MSPGATGYLIRDLAEIAMGVERAEEFRHHALDRLTNAVGADAGSYCSVGEDPAGLSAALIGTEAPVAQLVRSVREVAPEELQRSLVPRTQEDADVITAERRDRRCERQLPLRLVAESIRSGDQLHTGQLQPRL